MPSKLDPNIDFPAKLLSTVNPARISTYSQYVVFWQLTDAFLVVVVNYFLHTEFVKVMVLRYLWYVDQTRPSFNKEVNNGR